MPSGLLYSKVQPFKQDNTVLSILESDRARFLKSQEAQAEKMQKHRAELFSGFDKVDAKGDFLKNSVDVMDQVMADRVKVFNQYESGKISEKDWLLYKAQSGKVPSLINATYQNYESKLSTLASGDEFLNSDAINQLTVAAHGLSMEYNPSTKKMEVSHDYVGDDGKKARRTTSLEGWNNWVQGFQGSAKLGNVSEDVMKFGDAFKSDVEQEASSYKSVKEKGLDVGTTRVRFDESFLAKYGGKDDLNNPYVMKMQGANESYEDAWNSMYNLAKSRVPREHLETVRAPTKTTTEASGGQKAFDKTFPSVVPNIKSIEVGGEKYNGKAVKFTTAEGKKALEIGVGDIAEFDVPEGSTKKMKLNAYFVTPNGKVFGKGTFPPKDQMEVLLKEDLNEDEFNKALSKANTTTRWVELNPEGETQVRSSLWGGLQGTEVYNRLEGESQTDTKKESDPLGLDL